ncbi:hypothetical protein AOLI_G00086780 [Acnodon oligacanthus]
MKATFPPRQRCNFPHTTHRPSRCEFQRGDGCSVMSEITAPLHCSNLTNDIMCRIKHRPSDEKKHVRHCPHRNGEEAPPAELGRTFIWLGLAFSPSVPQREGKL